MRISESIKRLRESKNLTQEQFGKIAGVSSMAVSQWENGRSVPRMGAIQKLSDFFGIPKSQIIGDAIDDAFDMSRRKMIYRDRANIIKDKPDYSGMSEDEYELLSLYRKMNAKERKLLLSMARGLLED